LQFIRFEFPATNMIQKDNDLSPENLKSPSPLPVIMQELAAVKLVVRRSRFFAHLYRLDDADDITAIIKTHRRSYKKANHHCYALRFPDSGNPEISRDDGEVGHPGKVLLRILKQHGFDAHALVVSRVFGGIKLGAGGVSRAFREAGEGAVEHYLSSSSSSSSSSPPPSFPSTGLKTGNSPD